MADEAVPKKPSMSCSPMGAALAIGIGVGAAIGAATDNLATGVGIGAAIGTAIGAGTTASQNKRFQSGPADPSKD